MPQLQEHGFIDGHMTYEALTQNIRVSVQVYYLADESDPESGDYFWAYRIRIRNEGTEAVQLINRFWEITDGNGKIEIVRGSGVVGEQPKILEGSEFYYTSGCPLKTPSGFMVGSFEMTTPEGRSFQVKIPTFSLDSPYQSLIIN